VSGRAQTVEVARAATAAYAAPDPDLDDLRHQLSVVHRTRRAPPEDDLAAWARALADPAGAFPLLGTGRRADTYPALLWGGARLARAGAGAEVAVLLAGLAAGQQADRNADDLGRAIRAGAAVDRALAAGEAVDPVARPTMAVLAAAAGAALLTGTSTEGLVRVLDTAASLMVLTPGADVPGAAAVRSLWIGHACAAGWLAAVLPELGITAMPGALAHTLQAATGTAPRDRTWLEHLGARSVRQLVQELG